MDHGKNLRGRFPHHGRNFAPDEPLRCVCAAAGDVGSRANGHGFRGVDGDDAGVAIASNGDNDAYVTGYANSSNFPTTLGAFQTAKASPGPQAFVTQVDSATFQGRIIHSTFLSSDGSTIPYAIVNNDARGVFVAGSTSSAHLPGGPVLTPNPTAGFVTKFSVDLSQVRYTQLLGLVVSGVALRKIVPDAPEIYTTGWRYTGGHDFDHEDAFVVKLEDDTPTSAIVSLPAKCDWSVLYGDLGRINHLIEYRDV